MAFDILFGVFVVANAVVIALETIYMPSPLQEPATGNATLFF
jgi:hypothetical protein